MNNENIVDYETAELELGHWAERMDLDWDEQYMDEDDLQALEKHQRRLIRSMQDGNVSFDEEGYITYQPTNKKSKHSERITFRERTGASLMAIDRYKDSEQVRKTYAIMSDITGLSPKHFSGLVGNDIKICESIFALLMD